MGIALSTYRQKAREEFPGIDLDLEDGSTLSLRSITDLDDDQLKRFVEVQALVEAANDDTNLLGAKDSFVLMLSEVSSDPEKAKTIFQAETLGTLMVLFQEYGDTVTDSAIKSVESA